MQYRYRYSTRSSSTVGAIGTAVLVGSYISYPCAQPAYASRILRRTSYTVVESAVLDLHVDLDVHVDALVVAVRTYPYMYSSTAVLVFE